MKKVLREKLKIWDVELHKLDYALMFHYNSCYVSSIKCRENSLERYIMIELITKRIDENMYRLELTANLYRLPKHDYSLSVDDAMQVCKYWEFILKKVVKLNDLNVCGSEQEMLDCVEDIVKKRRSVDLECF